MTTTNIFKLDYDMDKITLYNIEDNLNTLNTLFKEVYYRYSASGDNLHVKVELPVWVKVEDLFILRELFQDDPVRLQLDIARFKANSEIIDVLFYKKNGNYAGVWHKFNGNLK